MTGVDRCWIHMKWATSCEECKMERLKTTNAALLNALEDLHAEFLGNPPHTKFEKDERQRVMDAAWTAIEKARR